MINIGKIAEDRFLKSFQQRLNEIFDSYIFEYNTKAVRNDIKLKVINLLEQARQQYVAEGRVLSLNSYKKPARDLGPIEIEIEEDPYDFTKLRITPNLSARYIMDEMEREEFDDWREI